MQESIYFASLTHLMKLIIQETFGETNHSDGVDPFWSLFSMSCPSPQSKFPEDRSSTVTFSDDTKVVTIECMKEDQTNREAIWYTAEEARRMRREYHRMEKDERENNPNATASRNRARKQSRYVVFCEHANQILEHGYLCDTERIALEYEKACKQSRILAIARAQFNAAAILE